MKRFTASYVYERSNFVLIGCDEPEDKDGDWYDLACVVANIIQRGTPTPAPKRLRDAIGSCPEAFKTTPRPPRSISSNKPVWESTIKGAPDGTWNPAKEFYEELLPAALPPELRYLTNYILPEARITDIIDYCDARFTEQCVDFYWPRAKLAIEIDGSQHGLTAESHLDKTRDRYLYKYGIQTIRIPTSSLDASFAANTLIGRFDFGDETPRDATEQLDRIARQYELAIRAQVAIVECIKTGVLNPSQPSWNIELVHDQPESESEGIVIAAIEDTLDLFEQLCILRNTSFSRPAIELCKRAEDLCLDLSATAYWSERESASGVVYARNDYYEDKQNFSVSCTDPIVYDTTTIERQNEVEAALQFFLQYLFGYQTFNPGQEGIIKRALARRPTLGILPTGSGKSLCYQLACLLQPCISFVVCPIISLIQDQDKNARDLGLCHVGRIESQMDRSGKNKVLEEFGQRRYQFIWIAPERFQMEDFRQQLNTISEHAQFGYAVIDEAHCLSEWGHDFRVSYLKLYDTIHTYCPQAIIVALTATASNNVLEDLLAELHISKADLQTSTSLDRPELTYHVIKTAENDRENKLSSILDEINATFRQREGVETIFNPIGEGGKDSICGIIFSNTKKSAPGHYASCKDVMALLARRGIAADVYHADRGSERTRVQKAFLDNEFTVMSATKAFGMGVNKKNVRYTIHDGLPWSIEAFYQEAGRAGRDKERAESECYILYSDASSPDVVEKVFAPGTSPEEIRNAVNYLDGDLSTLFFLWSLNHEDVDIETQAIKAVFGELIRNRGESGRVVMPFDFAKNLVLRPTPNNPEPKLHITTQDAIYKLALLGIVRDWTVDYRTKTYNVIVEDIDSTSESHVRESLERYIKRHDPQFSFDSKRQENRRYIEAYEQAPDGRRLIGLIKALLIWSDDHITYNRRQAIKNILDLCEKLPGKEEFRQYINNFFRLNTDNSEQLDHVIKTTDDLDVWVRLFTQFDDDPQVSVEHLKDIGELQAISALCDRYRESYHDNIGLEWATMVARLLSGMFSREETATLFAFVDSVAGDYDNLDSEELFTRTIELLENASADARSAFGSAVVRHTPQRALQTYERLRDPATLEHLVSSATTSLRKTWGRTSNT